MNSATLIPALKLTLNILDNVEISIQYCTIANKNGEKSPFDQNNPPTAVVHLNIDER
jgi:hypothetical protein